MHDDHEGTRETRQRRGLTATGQGTFGDRPQKRPRRGPRRAAALRPHSSAHMFYAFLHQDALNRLVASPPPVTKWRNGARGDR